MSCKCTGNSIGECCCKNKGHIHAEKMAKYAQDAKETDKPWERWEYFYRPNNKWYPLPESSQTFHKTVQYRRKSQKKIYRRYLLLTKNGVLYIQDKIFLESFINQFPECELREITWEVEE